MTIYPYRHTLPPPAPSIFYLLETLLAVKSIQTFEPSFKMLRVGFNLICLTDELLPIAHVMSSLL